MSVAPGPRKLSCPEGTHTVKSPSISRGRGTPLPRPRKFSLTLGFSHAQLTNNVVSPRLILFSFLGLSGPGLGLVSLYDDARGM